MTSHATRLVHYSALELLLTAFLAASVMAQAPAQQPGTSRIVALPTVASLFEPLQATVRQLGQLCNDLGSGETPRSSAAIDDLARRRCYGPLRIAFLTSDSWWVVSRIAPKLAEADLRGDADVGKRAVAELRHRDRDMVVGGTEQKHDFEKTQVAMITIIGRVTGRDYLGNIPRSMDWNVAVKRTVGEAEEDLAELGRRER